MTTPLRMEIDPITGKLIPVTDLTDIESRVTTLENKYVITTRFASVSGTSGAVTLPTDSTVRLDDFGGTVDAIVLTISGGKPGNENVYTSAGALVTTTFDASGNFSLSGTPAAYPVAIVYRVITKLVDFNVADSSIFGEVEYIVDPIPQETHIEGLTFEGPIQSNVLVTALQKTAHSIYETGRSGLTSWSGSGNYWSWTPGNPGTFTLLRGGEGYIRHKEVLFSSGQTVTLAYGDYKYLYIDENGTLQKSDTNSAEDKRSRINLFLAQNDVNGEFLAIRNDHRFTLDSGAREWMDSGFGCVLGSEPGSSDISRYGTGTGASTTDRMVNITSGRLIDADIVESWSAVTTGIDINHTYRRNDGFFARDSKSQQFPMKYNLSGTPTALTNGEFGVYRLFMMKSSLNDNPPQFISEMHTAKFGNVTQAQTAIASGTISNFGAFNNELAQVCYVIVAMNASGGYIHSVQVEKTTFRQVTGGSGVGSTASNVVTDVSLFDKVLSAADTTVQAALNTIDEVAQRKDSIGATIAAASEKTIPVDADMVGLMDSADSNLLKKLSWTNIKATLKTYFDTLYPSSAVVLSGTYSPTITRDANLDATTAYTCIYCRVGNVVTVSGEFAADPTSASAATALRMTLPIASDLSATGDCSGVANGQAASANHWNITPSTSTNQAIFACPSPGVTGNTGYSFVFQYIIK